MSVLTVWHRVYFVAVGVFALWVGVWGYLSPADIERAIPWQVPPLHARFIASMYLSGTVVMFGAATARRLHEVRVVTIMAAVWTGMLLVVSLFNLPAFDWGQIQVWFWFFAYVAFPLGGGWLAWRHRARSYPQDGAAPSLAYRRALLVLGIVCLALSSALFLTPAAMTGIWPWQIDTLLAQIYSGPFLSYAVGGLLLFRCTRVTEMRLPLLSIFAFTALVLVASLMHRDVFSPIGPSAILWFTSLPAAAVLAALGLPSRTPKGVMSDG